MLYVLTNKKKKQRFTIIFFSLTATINREYVLIEKDLNYNQAPQTHFMSFNGISEASIVEKKDFSGKLNNDFTIRMWMKHSNEESDEKEHIFCKSDEKRKKIFFLFLEKNISFCMFLVKNRHHIALFVQGDFLKLSIRKGPLSSNDKNVY